MSVLQSEMDKSVGEVINVEGDKLVQQFKARERPTAGKLKSPVVLNADDGLLLSGWRAVIQWVPVDK